MTELTDLFTSVAYPVAISICLLFYIYKDLKENRQAIENNTKVLNKLLTLFEHFFKQEIDDE